MIIIKGKVQPPDRGIRPYKHKEWGPFTRPSPSWIWFNHPLQTTTFILVAGQIWSHVISLNINKWVKTHSKDNFKVGVIKNSI